MTQNKIAKVHHTSWPQIHGVGAIRGSGEVGYTDDDWAEVTCEWCRLEMPQQEPARSPEYRVPQEVTDRDRIEITEGLEQLRALLAEAAKVAAVLESVARPLSSTETAEQPSGVVREGSGDSEGAEKP